MMRRLTLWLFALVLIGAGFTPGPAAASPAMPAPLPSPSDPAYDTLWQLTPPVVDGDLSDWATLPKMTLDRTTASWPTTGGPAPEDLSAWASLVWTSQHLYIALWVTDDNIVRNSRNWHFDDMAQFTFDIDLDDDISMADQRYTISPEGLITNNGGLPLGTTAVVQPHPEGWHAEVRVPLRDFGSDFLTNAEVGFTWGVQDDDGGGVRDTLVWAGSSYERPATGQGLLRFTNGPTREWRTFDTGAGWPGLADTTIANWYPDRNFGAERNLFLRSANDWHLLFHITPPQLGPNERALRARLKFTVKEVQRDGINNTRVYRLLKPWTEMGATWNLASPGNFWTIPGASSAGNDFVAVPEFEFRLRGAGLYTLDISDQMLSWYANPQDNHGLLFRAEDGTRRAITIEPKECGAGCGPVLELLVESPPPSP
ncbi:MAG: DNRLRE domain-containing protein [Caldilineales bacterium]|nr:DNRLRE domain-containing protein [Caldilineales bacterium]